MTTKEDLLFLRDFEFRQRQREREIEHLREKAGLHAVQYDKILTQGGAQRDAMAEHAAAVDEAERRYAKESLEDKARYLRIVDDIMRLPPREMEIIRLRYQEAHSWGWIRRRTHYEKSHLFRIHKHALDLLSEEGT